MHDKINITKVLCSQCESVPGEKVLRMYLSNNMKNSSNTEGFWDKYYIYIG